ncbi:hypothetical protein B0H21DRAFT_823361 [Amylocystis lapponica]|nr:hypothetical protein B0H21DRAFT_823361 [Amylocystis lapponica]
MAFPRISFIFEFYDADEEPLLPVRLERVHPTGSPIRAPRPTLHGSRDWMLAMKEHNYTMEEEVHALGHDLLDAISNPTWVESSFVKKAALCATNGVGEPQSSVSETGLRSPVPRDWSPKHRERSDRSSTSSISSKADSLISPVVSAPEWPAVRSGIDVEDGPVCINIDACILEVKRLEWRRQLRTFIHQRVWRRVQVRAITPDRLGARLPFVEV